MKDYMKYNFLWACKAVVSSLILSCILSYPTLLVAQTQNADSMSALFVLDEAMLNSSYPNASVKPLFIPPSNNSDFSHTLRFHYTPNTLATPYFIILTTDNLYSSLSQEIKRFAEDIHSIYGYGIYLESVTGGNPSQIKSIIISHMDNLKGAIFIGDLGYCLYEISLDYNRTDYGYKKWPCDLYYMDLNGTWTDTDNNGIYDLHSGDLGPEITFGRLSASGMSNLGDEVTLIKKQLDKSHNFWWKNSYHSANKSLNYIYKDWNNIFLSQYVAKTFSSLSVDDIRDGYSAAFSKTDYLSRLSQSQYGFLHLAAHSSPTLHTFKDSGGYIYLSEIQNAVTDNNCLGYNLFCCSACNWLAASSQGYLGGMYLFNNGRTLAVVGSTKTGGMYSSDIFYNYMEHKSIGESFKDWFRSQLGNSYSTSNVSWFYGMTILGDPTINLRHNVSDVCVANLTLSSFPTANKSNLIMYKAESKITVQGSFTIPEGVHVIFDAPQVILEKNFICPTGSSFETRSEGCEL